MGILRKGVDRLVHASCVPRAFLWKPKLRIPGLRIPDIYENHANQLAFGRFLNACACCTEEAQVLAAIRALDGAAIKGPGPAATPQGQSAAGTKAGLLVEQAGGVATHDPAHGGATIRERG